MVNENLILVGPYMMPYASGGGYKDKQIKREKEGNVNTEEEKKPTPPDTVFSRALVIEEEDLYDACVAMCYFCIRAYNPDHLILLPSLHRSLLHI